MSQNRQKCLICETRPAHGGGSYCKICDDQLQAEYRRRQANEPVQFLTYRGVVVGLYQNGGETLIPRLLKRDPKKLPKCRTIDLNVYQKGYTREQIGRLKKAVKQCVQLKI